MRVFMGMVWILIPLMLISGCGQKEELERQAFVVALGLDKGEKDHMIEVTFQIANPQVNTSQLAEAQNEPPSDIVTVTAPDILSAKELVHTSHSRRVRFSHLKTIIIGEELARSEVFSNIIESAIVDPEVRRESMMIVSKEKASEFIHKNKPIMETRPHKYYEFMQKIWKQTGLVPPSNLNTLFQRIQGELFLVIYATAEREEVGEHQNEDTYLAGQVPQKAGDPVQMIGSAVLRNRKMIGTLTGEETRIAMLLREEPVFDAIITSFPDPVKEGSRISVRLIETSPTRVKVDTKQEPAKVNVQVPVVLQIHSNPANVSYTTNQHNQNLLKKSIKKRLEERSARLVEKMQNEFKGEAFVWYVPARKQFWTVKQYEDYNWEKKFQQADVDINYEVKIENFGEQIKPPSNKD
ncbi:Ger(x)C family spore germination protein [Siminovitchia sediminis]|uniref:Ger(X)C family spore germination protein n=1 Tax=Siminovitchia sediminis TaxID=1274353 RepID=A0ABW4KHF3_9BACI